LSCELSLARAFAAPAVRKEPSETRRRQGAPNLATDFSIFRYDGSRPARIYVELA
jgi:hypothetical protein